MTIEYIQLNKDDANVFWETGVPNLFLDDNMLISLPEAIFCHYDELAHSIQKNNRYCLQSISKKKVIIEFMPFASRRLRKYLNESNTTKSQVPLITYYLGQYYIYISHNQISALLKVSNEEVTNEFLDIVDNIYEIN